MTEIIIYPDEASIAGLAEQIKADSKIQYYTAIESYEKALASSDLNGYLQKAISNDSFLTDINGLYPTFSVLASTVWNINDDVLGPSETWAARKTPANKPTNIDHDEHQVVGHMIDSWVIDAEGKTIADDTLEESLPEIFHVCNSAVIYTNWTDPALIERTRALIEAIKNNEMFVSMECIFRGFDYAIISPDNIFYKLARGSQTAFLSKHLKRYGGTGTYQDHKIGRYLKDYVFSAKGYVRRPANTASVIFSHGLPKATASLLGKPIEENPFIKKAGVSLVRSQATSDICNTEIEIVNPTEIQAALDVALAEKAALSAKVDELTASHAALSATLAGLEADKASLITSAAADKATIEGLNTEINTAKAEKLFANRVTLLVDGGIEKTDAEGKVKVFSNLNDEQFTVVATEIVKAAQAAKAAVVVAVAPVVETTVDAAEVDDAGEVAAAGALDSVVVEPVVNIVPDVSAEAVNETRIALLTKALQEKRTR
jgi:hypothetical protein